MQEAEFTFFREFQKKFNKYFIHLITKNNLKILHYWSILRIPCEVSKLNLNHLTLLTKNKLINSSF